jgi:drug/metabolite transporter (DMT)-like permease
MDGRGIYPRALALAAALMFGASVPLSKSLFSSAEPLMVAGLLYLGMGIGMLPVKAYMTLFGKGSLAEEPLARSDMPWVFGTVLFGGILAPVVMMISLDHTPGSTAALLLNFEGVATGLIALFIFKEAIGKRVWIAIALITAGCSVLSLREGGRWGISLGALGIMATCVLWAIDNNITRRISGKDQYMIVVIKGLGAGTFTLVLATLLGVKLPSIGAMLLAMLLGLISYGVSMAMIVVAMRHLGAARTAAFFGVGPFAGALLSFIVLRETAEIFFWMALVPMAAGVFLLLSETHAHPHTHTVLRHSHKHTHDEHHQHRHKGKPPHEHTHMHEHTLLTHSHPHAPDLHHRHTHGP